MQNASVQRLEFDGHSGAKLSARLDLPSGQVRAYALFAHCFTCGKDTLAARRIAGQLASHGIAVMRFDFTGLGSSDGEFGSTNFSSNIEDLVLAADYLTKNYAAPSILIGHSLGGSAVLAAASKIPAAKAIVTLGAPADTAHVLHNLGEGLKQVETEGAATISIAGRPFNIQKHFIEDVRETKLLEAVRNLKRPLLVMHAPLDATVGIENASSIFDAAQHPKSFVSLDQADHLISKPADSEFAATVIAGWVSRYITADEAEASANGGIVSVETGGGKFQNRILSGSHQLIADEPNSMGGLNSGPSPYDFLSIALAACTSMTLRMYGERKNYNFGRISVRVEHDKIHAQDCETCSDQHIEKGGRIDHFQRIITIDSDLPEDVRARIVQIADMCPVHRTLESSSSVATRFEES